MRWTPVAERDLTQWDHRLAAAEAPLYQLPRWNAFISRRGLRPVHVVGREGGRDVAFATILRVGVWPLRFALLQRGPICLDPSAPVAPVLADLAQWVRRRGDILLRVTSADGDVLAAARAQRGAVAVDLFTAFPDDDHDLLLPQSADPEETFARFTRSGRLAVRRGEKAGYKVRRGTADDLERSVVPMFEKLADRKGFRARPREAFAHLFTTVERAGDGGIYLGELDGVPVAAVLVVRDGPTLRYVWGALDRDARPPRTTSPSSLVHWVAMREGYDAGIETYNLGPGSPASVAEFKLRFNPVRVEVGAVTVPTSRVRFLLWHRVGVPLLAWGWPHVQRLRSS